jgi:hypothetical protein
MENKIQYIIDHPGYGNKFTVTATKNGFQVEVEKATVSTYVGLYNCFFSARANAQMRAVPQREIISGTKDALASLSIR